MHMCLAIVYSEEIESNKLLKVCSISSYSLKKKFLPYSYLVRSFLKVYGFKSVYFCPTYILACLVDSGHLL